MTTFTTTLSVFGDDPEEYTEHEVEIDFRLIAHSYRGRGPDLNGPGEPPEPAGFEIEEIRLIVARLKQLNTLLTAHREHTVTITLTEDQFRFLSPVCKRILDNAYEWAAEHEGDF